MNEKSEVCDYNHLLLYSKCWYQMSDNVVVDVRKIISHRNGVDSEFISDQTLWASLIRAFVKYAELKDVQSFMEDMFKGSLCGFDDKCSFEKAVGIIVGKLSTVPVTRDNGEIFLNLGKPDSAILPLRQEGV